MPKSSSPIIGRRRVLQGAALVGAATLAPSVAAKSENTSTVMPMTHQVSVEELTADEIVALLKLEPNATCGFVRVTFLSKHSIAAGGLPAPFAAGRPLGSALYFMVTSGAPVRLHRIRNEQLYHYYLGDPLSPNASKWTRKKFASWDRKACSCARSLPLQARKRRVLALPVLYRSGAPEEIRTPDPQIRSLVFAPPARPRNPAGTGSEEIGGHVQDRGRGSFHDPFCEKPAIRLSQKGLAFRCEQSGSVARPTRWHGLVPGSCPAGFLATAGLWW